MGRMRKKKDIMKRRIAKKKKYGNLCTRKVYKILSTCYKISISWSPLSRMSVQPTSRRPFVLHSPVEIHLIFAALVRFAYNARCVYCVY